MKRVWEERLCFTTAVLSVPLWEAGEQGEKMKSRISPVELANRINDFYVV